MSTATLNEAGEKLRRLASVGSPHGARVNAEQQYGQAYQACVRAGEAPQLRLRYRRAGGANQAGGHNNMGSSMGKHVPHPVVHGFKVKHYKCEPRWNPREK